jgi:hypothetical protein
VVGGCGVSVGGGLGVFVSGLCVLGTLVVGIIVGGSTVIVGGIGVMDGGIDVVGGRDVRVTTGVSVRGGKGVLLGIGV